MGGSGGPAEVFGGEAGQVATPGDQSQGEEEAPVCPQQEGRLKKRQLWYDFSKTNDFFVSL